MPIAVFALTAGAFGIGTTEFVIMGLLLQVSADLGVSIPAAGLLISGYALGVFVGAPLLTLATRRMPRKTVLLALMVIFTLGNLACALAPNYEALMAARVLTSLAHGTFFGVGSVVATGLVARRPPRLGHRDHVHRPDRRRRCSACRSAPGSACASAGARRSGRWRRSAWSRIAVLAALRAARRGERASAGAAARRVGGARPAAGAAGPADDGARLCRRLRGLHLHPADPDPTSPAFPRRRCRRSCWCSAPAWSVGNLARRPARRPRACAGADRHAGGARRSCWR